MNSRLFSPTAAQPSNRLHGDEIHVTAADMEDGVDSAFILDFHGRDQRRQTRRRARPVRNVQDIDARGGANFRLFKDRVKIPTARRRHFDSRDPFAFRQFSTKT